MSDVRRIERAAKDAYARQLRLVKHRRGVLLRPVILIGVRAILLLSVSHLVAPFQLVIADENSIANLNACFFQRLSDAECL